MKPARRLHATEDQEQAAIVEWSRLVRIVVDGRNVPLSDHLYAVPNGEAFNSRAFTKQQILARRRRLLELGFQDGALDLNIDVARGPWHGMRLEVKAHRGVVSPSQHEWLRRHRAAGYFATVAFGASAGIAAITDYLHGGGEAISTAPWSA